ncbi:RNA-binding S4 domain-containing protein [Wohlfahrtiimonas chitiniclastica]|uniref:RNA-binding S4 domain-containing protein n=1 Tax=Wohlfahrtiimonas chitiniclastica TaxID=400946 RepID=UPI00047834B7|nr:RNA-binding S4 domain-containing protein [Wohlfahrtiimonas chitiniclastica]
MTQQTKFYLESHPHVALNDLLKMVGIADTGGRAKLMVAEGNISVNGAIELRKTAKIHAGSIVTGIGFEILVCEGFEA